jgi:hypothetical protein
MTRSQECIQQEGKAIHIQLATLCRRIAPMPGTVIAPLALDETIWRYPAPKEPYSREISIADAEKEHPALRFKLALTALRPLFSASTIALGLLVLSLALGLLLANSAP